MDALSAIGFYLVLIYSLLTVLGLSITIHVIGFHILWSFIKNPINHFLGSDNSEIFYWFGLAIFIMLAAIHAKRFIKNYELKYGKGSL